MTKRRVQRGFTLVEVALAIALGILIVIASLLGFNAVRQSQAEREARARLGSLKGVVEQISAANNGTPPLLASLQAVWTDRRKEDVLNSPWGGQSLPTGAAAGIGGWGTAAINVPLAGVTTNLAGIGYATATGSVITVFDRAIGFTVLVRNYAMFYFDKNGNGPWFVTGGDL